MRRLPPFAICLIVLTVGPFMQRGFAEGTVHSDAVGIGYPATIFIDVDPSDAHVALALWTKQVSATMGTPLAPRTLLFEGLHDLEKAFRDEEIEVATMGIVDFLKVRDRVNIEPFLVAESGDKAGERFLLVCHRDRNIKGIQQMRGYRLTIETGHVSNPLTLLWLETLLLKKDLGKQDSFFSELPRVEKTSKAVLPVFFRNSDACLVTERGYNTICEMNPQVGEELSVISRSPRLVRALTAIRSNCDKRIRRILEEGAIKLDQFPKGRQILTIFRQTRIVPFHPDHLKGVIALLDDLSALRLSVKGNQTR
jgi:ABC-type phosphate/phosphonate transport system substrate-binding protein